jgi:hypothetical protein
MACHNGLTTAGGEDISIGTDWRGSIMANSSRDPYWQASVRRETIEHPAAAPAIEDECAVCHMPMSRTQARTDGRRGKVFAHLPAGAGEAPEDLLAHDGVSCTMCHQITAHNFGTAASFTGGFLVDPARRGDGRPLFGPFAVDKGRTRIMRSSSGFLPTEGPHVRQSELCATCHTLYTKALNPRGEVIGQLPEQVPYLEWKHSAFPAEDRSCQACHMPVVREEVPMASVLGIPRQGVARHSFNGGNFFMLRMLNEYRTDLGVTALPKELDASIRGTVQQLQSVTASVSVDRFVRSGDRVEIDVTVRNLTGHKLPTGYPSRRAWLDVIVSDASGNQIFRSGRLSPAGLIEGNDNDVDPSRYEPHYTEIHQADQVQIYESVMVDSAGEVTTGLLNALRYIKDNRLLPRGFEKSTAHADIKVAGSAATDADFGGGIDRVRYSVLVPALTGQVNVEVALRFQPIAYRWAQNLKSFDAVETRRFVGYFEAMASGSSEVLAQSRATAQD